MLESTRLPVEFSDLQNMADLFATSDDLNAPRVWMALQLRYVADLWMQFGRALALSMNILITMTMIQRICLGVWLKRRARLRSRSANQRAFNNR